MDPVKEHRIAIYGAGAMGTVLGTFLAKAGIRACLVTRNAAHVEALRAGRGRTVLTDGTEIACPTDACLPGEMEGTYDIIFLMTKQRENPAIAEFLRDYLAEDGALCTCQNGLPEKKLAAILGEDRVLGCAVVWGASFLEPGRVALTSETSAMSFLLGGAGGHPNRLAEVREILSAVGPVTTEENFLGARWSKLLINAAFSGVSVLTDLSYGEIAKGRSSRKLARAIAKECVRAAEKDGVVFGPVQGHRADKILASGGLCALLAPVLYPAAIKKHALLHSGMLRDLKDGKPCDIDFVNGVIAETGRTNGTPVPYNLAVVRTVHEIERGEREISPANIEVCLRRAKEETRKNREKKTC